MKLSDKRIIIITGHYGSGKTNLAVNLAFLMAKSGVVRLVDLDIVNPYFRAYDMSDILKKAGIDVIAPVYAGSNLDIPALPPQIYSAFDDKSSRVVLDVGGDDAGAAALGRYSGLILSENNYTHLYVINARRILTQTPENAIAVMREIEAMGHIPVTAIVNNTNLAHETDAGVIRESAAFAAEVSRLSSLPLAFTSVKENVAAQLGYMQNIMPVKIYVHTPWDEDQ